MQELTQAGVASGSIPGVKPLGRARIDAVDAKRAFRRHREAAAIEGLVLGSGRPAAIGEARTVGLVARLIGAGDGAIAAADAEIVIDGDDAVRALARGGRRTHAHAGRLVAMHAAHRHEDALHLGIFADFHVEHAPPLHAGRRRVGLFARGGAGLAADAAPEVGDHGPAGHSRPPARARLTRTRSAPEPVASVSSSDIGTKRVHAGNAEILGEGRRPVIELPDHEQRVGADALAQHGAAAGGAQGRADLDRDRRRRCRGAAAVLALMMTPPWPATFWATSWINLDADIAAPGVLHAARGHEPERKILPSSAAASRRPPFPTAPGKSFHAGSD